MGFWWKVLSTGASWVFSLVILGLGQGTAQTLRETDDLFHPLPQWQSVKHASPYPVSAEDVFTIAFFLLTGELQCKGEQGDWSGGGGGVWEGDLEFKYSTQVKQFTKHFT